jgi:D-alanyl-D-alanine carboxypeptidase
LAPFLTSDLMLTAQSWSIFDCKTKSLIYGQYETIRREVASITKMMTFYTVLNFMDEYNIDPSLTFITISR